MSIGVAYYVHNLDPVIFEFGFLKPRWYGFAYLMGFLGAYLLLKKLSRDGMLRLDPARLPDLVLNSCILGILIGGRLGFVLFYNLPNALQEGIRPMLWDFSSIEVGGWHIPFWGALRVWDGGMAAHGGIVFTILTLAWFARRYKTSFVNLGDAACMVVPVGLCFGRIANFINGELYGHPTTVPWAVKFPSEIYAPTNREMLPSVQDHLPEIMQRVLGPGDWFSAQGYDEGLSLLSQKLMHHQASTVELVSYYLPPRHPSQLYEALLEGLLLFIICWTIGRLWRKDGMASGAFLTLYPVMRIIGEQFRVGDTPVHLAGWQISKGVLYSLPLVFVGLAYWGYWIHRDRRVPWIPRKPESAADSVPPAPGTSGGAASAEPPGGKTA